MSEPVVFSYVTADLAVDFVNRFAENFNFNEKLEYVCKTEGVKIMMVHNTQHILMGQWESVCHVYENLLGLLTTYDESVAIDSPGNKKIEAHNNAITDFVTEDGQDTGEPKMYLQAINEAFEVLTEDESENLTGDDAGKDTSLHSSENVVPVIGNFCTTNETSDWSVSKETDDFEIIRKNENPDCDVNSDICENVIENSDDNSKEMEKVERDANELEETNKNETNLDRYDSEMQHNTELIGKVLKINRSTRNSKYFMSKTGNKFQIQTNLKYNSKKKKEAIQFIKKQKLKSTMKSSGIKGHVLKRKGASATQKRMSSTKLASSNKKRYHDNKTTTKLVKDYECRLCGGIFKSAVDLKKHYKLHGKVHKCQTCSKEYKSQKWLKIHEKGHEKTKTNSNKKPLKYSCKVCSTSFTKKRNLDFHIISEHLDKISSGDNTLSELELLGKGMVENHDSEPAKSEQDSKPKDTWVNIESFVNQEIENKSSDMKKKKLYKHKSEESSGVCKCNICEKIFSTKNKLRRHCIYAHLQKGHLCEVCGAVYKTKASFKEHTKSHEEDYIKPSFQCKLCPKLFTKANRLVYHVKTQHLGEKKYYLCSFCGRSFKTRVSLNGHSNMHTGNRPYKCEICGKSFAYSANLREHKDLHNYNKRYECDQCDKFFQQKKGLVYHKKKHHRTHQMDKPSQEVLCNQCGKKFSSFSNLQRHERTHEGVRPFYCKVCQKSYTDISVIRRHLIRIHKIHKDKDTWKEDIYTM